MQETDLADADLEEHRNDHEPRPARQPQTALAGLMENCLACLSLAGMVKKVVSITRS